MIEKLSLIEAEDLISSMIDRFHPVGSIYLTIGKEDPNVTLGGGIVSGN